MLPDAPRVNTSWLVWVAGVCARTHIVKTRESVAKSRNRVNEKSASGAEKCTRYLLRFKQMEG
ncbi:MAG: hypothetical protein NTAFB01_03190 [Nitrospira sp.]